MKTVLHLGCGRSGLLEERFPRSEWREIRVDLDPEVDPDVVADIRALPFENESADGILCLACLEHLEEASLSVTLRGFNRVLREGGVLVLCVPDLKAVCQEVVDGKLLDVVDVPPCGPIRPLDIIYGLASEMATSPLMVHRTGFTAETLLMWVTAAGFEGEIGRMGKYVLWIDARKA